jgi:integrase
MPRPKGQITRIKNGVWQMRVQRIVDGKRKSVSKRFKTREKAQEALDSLFDELAAPSPAYRTGKQLFDQFLLITKPDIKQQTFELYERIIKNHLRDAFDSLALSEITPLILERYFAGKKASLSPVMVSKIYRLLKTMLEKAARWDWITKNPMMEIKAPKLVKKSKEILTPEELSAFFAACPPEQRTQWIFTALVGCRTGETLGAKWKDIDFDKKVFNVTEVLVRLKKPEGEKRDVWKFDTPKTQSSIRKIPLSDDLISILKKHKVEQNKIRLRIGDLWQDYDLIFPTRYGKPQRLSNIGQKVKRIAKEAGIDKTVSPHALRHSYITLAIDNGMDIKTVSEMVGHSDIRVTLNIYKQTKFSDKRAVAETISGLILNAVPKMCDENESYSILDGETQPNDAAESAKVSKSRLKAVKSG